MSLDLFAVGLSGLSNLNAGTNINISGTPTNPIINVVNDPTFSGDVTLQANLITPNSNNLTSLTTIEVTQLLNIGATTISAAQWGYLGELDQSLIQASSPTFAGLTITNPINEFSVDGTLAGNSDTAIPTEKAVKTYADAIIAGDIAIDLLGSPTYTSIQDLIKTTLSAGRTSGGTITAHAPLDGTIDISTGTGFIKTTDNEVGDTKSFDFPAKSSLALVDNDTNYIYVDYAAGSPEVKTTTDRSTINGHTQFTLGRVYREGTDLHIVNTGTNLAGFIHHNHERLILVRGFERASGGVVSETGTRNIALTAGVFFLGANKHETTAQDTSDTDTFTYWHRDGGGGWTKTAAQTQIDNLRYDDGDGTLGNLTPNRYGVHWIFIHYDGDMQVIYGQGDYKITDAENATVPTGLPEELSSFSVLASKIIIQQNTASFSSAVTAYETLFPVSAPSAHNDLSLLQGGTGDEYYHLDLTEFNFLDGIDQAIKTTDDVTFNQLTLGAGNLIVGAVQLSNAEWTQLTNIGATTIIAAQWGYLGAVTESIQTHMSSSANPHTVSASDVGLGNVDNVANVNQTSLGTVTVGDIDAIANYYTLTTDLSANEITQLQAIGEVTTIIAAQWGYLGAVTEDIQTHMSSSANPHTVSASDVGLGNVDNIANANQTSLGTVVSGDIDAIANYYTLTTDLSANEITQLQAIGEVTTIIAAQWGYLGALTEDVQTFMDTFGTITNTPSIDQSLLSTGSPTFSILNLTSSLNITGITDSVINLNATDDSWAYLSFKHSGVRKGYLGINSTPDFLMIAEAGDIVLQGTEVKFTGITSVTGAFSITSTFTTVNSNNLSSLTTAEVTQLLNIGDVTTIIAAQWGYLGAVTEDIQTHMSSVANPHTVSASDVGLGNVDNVANANQTSLGTVVSGDIDAIANYYTLTTDLTTGEITQLQAIGDITITYGQWGYLGAVTEDIQTFINTFGTITNTPSLDQTLLTSGSPTFVGMLLSGELDLTGIGAKIDLNPSSTDSLITIDITPSTALTGAGAQFSGINMNLNATDPAAGVTGVYGIYIEMGGVSQTNNPETQGIGINMPASYGTSPNMWAGKFMGDGRSVEFCNTDYAIETANPVALTGTINTANSNNLDDMTTAEFTQLANINSVTITNAQWSILGALNQGLTTSSDVQFDKITIIPTGAGDVINITPTITLPASSAWGGFGINGNSLDPTGANCEISGIYINFTGINMANNPKVWGLRILMPAVYGSAEEYVANFQGDGNSVLFCTDTYAMHVDTGNVQFDGNLTVDGTFTTANSNNLGSLITAEVTQLLNIDTTTISGTQWGYLGAVSESIQTHMSDSTKHLPNVNLNTTALGDNTASGVKMGFVAGENLAFPNLVCIKTNGRVYKTDADSVATMPCIGMALETKTTGNAIQILLLGYVRDDDWTWVLGDGQTNVLYADNTTAGGMTITPPAGANDQVQAVGVILHADYIYFNPSLVLVKVAVP